MYDVVTVERAFFMWGKWRRSIVDHWVSAIELSELPPHEMRLEARGRLKPLDFPDCIWLELYWISAVASDCCLDHEPSFEKIVIPAWLSWPLGETIPSFHDLLRAGCRAYPPQVWRKGDVAFHHAAWTVPRIFFSPGHPQVLLPSEHEFYPILSRLRGRPRKRAVRAGRAPRYSDRLAVKCAVAKQAMTYTEIARRFGLDTTIKTPYSSEQSDTVRHLVQRGERLLEECGL